jgi:phosphoglycolate phosphatase
MTRSFPHSCRLFLFDLDGTLIDSRADLAFSLNLALERLDLSRLPESRIIGFVGEGVQILMRRSLRESTGHEPEDSLIKKGTTLFREEYGKHLLDRTRLYPNVIEALDRLAWATLAVVSNKPEGFSRRILEEFDLAKRFITILGGDSTQNPKPHPEPLLRVMNMCKAIPSETVMVGDSATDIKAGKAAGTITCGVQGGFRPVEQLKEAGCDLILENLLKLSDHFFPSE